MTTVTRRSVVIDCVAVPDWYKSFCKMGPCTALWEGSWNLFCRVQTMAEAGD